MLTDPQALFLAGSVSLSIIAIGVGFSRALRAVREELINRIDTLGIEVAFQEALIETLRYRCLKLQRLHDAKSVAESALPVDDSPANIVNP
jgi:hypothetical protein